MHSQLYLSSVCINSKIYKGFECPIRKNKKNNNNKVLHIITLPTNNFHCVTTSKLDASFRGTVQRFIAHNTIQASVHPHNTISHSCSNLKKKKVNSAVADVIQYMIEKFESGLLEDNKSYKSP